MNTTDLVDRIAAKVVRDQLKEPKVGAGKGKGKQGARAAASAIPGSRRVAGRG